MALIVVALSASIVTLAACATVTICAALIDWMLS